jgi:hypothetical protein
MPDREAAAKVVPKSAKDRRKLWSIGGYLGLMVVFVVAGSIFSAEAPAGDREHMAKRDSDD